jgi:hypothetical protein
LSPAIDWIVSSIWSGRIDDGCPFQALAILYKGRRAFTAAGCEGFAPTAPVFGVAWIGNLRAAGDSSRSTQSTSAWQIRNSDDVLALAVADLSGLIVVVVIGMVAVSAMILPVIGHRISNCCAPNPTHDRADRTADNGPRNRTPNPSSDRAAFVGKGNLR